VALSPFGTGGAQDFYVRAVLDPDEFNKGLKSMEKGATMSAASIEKLGASFVRFGAWATAAMGAVAYKAFNSAMEAEAAARKFAAVFGTAAKATTKWAEELGDRFGSTVDEMQRFLAQTQDLLVPMGLGRDKAAELSKSVTELGLKLAIFNGQPTEMVLMNIQSGLVGVTRSMRQYGVMLTEQRTAQEAVTLGLAKTTKEVSESAKVQARLSLMLKDSSDAWNKAETMMNGAVAVHKLVGKEIRVLWNDLGDQLMPLIEDYRKQILEVIKGTSQWIKNNGPLVREFAQTAISIAKLTVAVKGLQIAFGALSKAKGLAMITSFLASTRGMNMSQAFGLGETSTMTMQGQGVMGGAAQQTLTSRTPTNMGQLGRAGLAVGGAAAGGYAVGSAIRTWWDARYVKSTLKEAREARGAAEKVLDEILSEQRVKMGQEVRKSASQGLAEAIQDISSLTNQFSKGIGADQLNPGEALVSAILKSIKEKKPQVQADMQELFNLGNIIEQEVASGKITRKIADTLNTARTEQLQLGVLHEETVSAMRLEKLSTYMEEAKKKEQEFMKWRFDTLMKSIAKENEARMKALSEIQAMEKRMSGHEQGLEQGMFDFRGDVLSKAGATPEEMWQRQQDRALELQGRAQEAAAGGDLERAMQLAEEAQNIWMDWARNAPEDLTEISDVLEQATNQITQIELELQAWGDTYIAEQQRIADEAAAKIEDMADDIASALEEVQMEIQRVINMAAEEKVLKFDTSDALNQIRTLQQELSKLEESANVTFMAGSGASANEPASLDRHRQQHGSLASGHGE